MKDKKIIVVVSILILVLIVLVVLLINNKGIINTKEENKNYEKDFGSYQISSNWIEVEHNNSRYRYVKKSEKGNYQTNNISIRQLENKYSKKNHMQFKNSILSSLAGQNLKDIQDIKASGSTTKNGDILYTFILSGDEGVTTEYCIIGDYKFILVTEVNLDKSEETDNIAKQIVDSFKWKD